ncbi:GNAT family N-acetyltransferase [Streptomyces sp. NPDC051561]|uniref:GNAT family N-acetyltransferase n=1 Tax=Streptomyces sp. NPDC051561 TaxID=3365658 RepID=UPI0037B511A9
MNTATTTPPSGTDWRLTPATPTDIDRIAELRAQVMRPDLERLGVYDPIRVRQRFRDSYTPEHTQLIEVAGTFAGCVVLRPEADTCRWLESFYVDPAHQGRGLGTAVLNALLAHSDRENFPVRLQVLQGSPARRLYERHGFVLEHEDPVDAFLIRLPRA